MPPDSVMGRPPQQEPGGRLGGSRGGSKGANPPPSSLSSEPESVYSACGWAQEGAHLGGPTSGGGAAGRSPFPRLEDPEDQRREGARWGPGAAPSPRPVQLCRQHPPAHTHVFRKHTQGAQTFSRPRGSGAQSPAAAWKWVGRSPPPSGAGSAAPDEGCGRLGGGCGPPPEPRQTPAA